MKTIGVVTVARSDYGILRPILQRIADDDELELKLYVAGTHFSHNHGQTADEIAADGFPFAAEIPIDAASDDPAAIGAAIGRGVDGFAAAFARERPDVLLLVGDRFEMLAAALASLAFGIPLAHVHGGESSEGAFDESIRHALTKLSHLHFAATDEAARRIIQLGEEPWRVTVSGAPALDALARVDPLGDTELEERLGMHLNGPTLVVTYHPATLDMEDVRERIAAVLAAVESSGLATVFTYPNADPGGVAIRELVDDYVGRHDNACAVASLGVRVYHSLLLRSAAMVGNSSSGIIEAASTRLPVVNVGIRQQGRLRPANVIDVEDDAESIAAGIRRAVSPEFRAALDGLVNPYGDGHASERIVETLRRTEPGPRLLLKRFESADG